MSGLQFSRNENSSAANYLKWRQPHPKLCERLVDSANIDARSLVLEIGCGPGLEARELIRLSKTKYVGLDISREMLDAANYTLQDLSGWKTVQANATSLPFSDNSFDVVLFIMSLHQIADKRQAIDEACRVLRPKGNLGVVTMQQCDLINLIEFRCFPRLLELERKRSIGVSGIMKHIDSAGLIENYRDSRILYETRHIDQAHKDRVKAKYFSSLRLLDLKSFEKGLVKLEEELALACFDEEVFCTEFVAKLHKPNLVNERRRNNDASYPLSMHA